MSALLAQDEKLDQLNLNKLALAHYQKAVKRYHNAAKAHIRLGMLPKLDNQANQALDCFNTTIALNKIAPWLSKMRWALHAFQSAT